MLYLLHFSRPLAHARHYLGWTRDAKTLPRRVEHHLNGRGARIMAAVVAAGITARVVWTGEGDRTEERRLKNQKHSPRLCPVCRAAAELRKPASRPRRKAA